MGTNDDSDSKKPRVLGRPSSGKHINLKTPPIPKRRNYKSQIPTELHLAPGQTDITPSQIRAVGKKLGINIPPELETIFAEKASARARASKEEREKSEQAKADIPKSEGVLSSQEKSSNEQAFIEQDQGQDTKFSPQSPAIIKPVEQRNTIQSPTLLQYTSVGFSTYYNSLYKRRGFQLEPHLYHIVLAALDDRIPKLLVTIGPGSGKSLLLSTVFPGFRLGTDSSYTILGISAGEALMQGFQSAVMETIEYDPAWRSFFPNTRPDKGKGWSTERGMFVTGHAPGDPDASYLACGLTSKRLTGVHARLIIGDDIHDEENSYSAESCMGVRETFYRQIMGRADPRGARFIFAGRRWHEEDLYGHLSDTGEWVVMNLPAIREGSERLYWDITLPDGLECCFTEMMRGQAPSNLGNDLRVANVR